MAKRDRDFIPALLISETERDRLRKRDWTKRVNTETPEDLWTTADCVENRFSGIRINRVNGDTEIWAVGKLLIRRKTQDVGRNPHILASMLEEAFASNGTILDIDVKIRKIRVDEKGRIKR